MTIENSEQLYELLKAKYSGGDHICAYIDIHSDGHSKVAPMLDELFRDSKISWACDSGVEFHFQINEPYQL
jgi:hypothetical protein